jgi:hypothetical protein
MERLQSCKRGITEQRKPAADNTGISRKNIPFEEDKKTTVIETSSF